MYGSKVKKSRGRPRKYGPTQTSSLAIKPVRDNNIGKYQSQLNTLANKLKRRQRRQAKKAW